LNNGVYLYNTISKGKKREVERSGILGERGKKRMRRRRGKQKIAEHYSPNDEAEMELPSFEASAFHATKTKSFAFLPYSHTVDSAT
jgi:hypothetical protein